MNAKFLKDRRVESMFNFVRPSVGAIGLIDIQFENGIELRNVRIARESIVTIPSEFAAAPVRTVGVPNAERQRAFMPMIAKKT
jgi:hypothetical protein